MADQKLTGTLIDELFEVVSSRKGADPGSSYTANLYARGTEKIAQKLGEEAVEAVIAAVGRNRAETIKESADVVYHLLVVLSDAGLTPEDLYQELARRQGLSGLDEKASREDT